MNINWFTLGDLAVLAVLWFELRGENVEKCEKDEKGEKGFKCEKGERGERWEPR